MVAIDVKHLSKTYSNGFKALKDLSLSIKQGDFFALLGANGAGKSTFISTIATLISKTSGDVKINGYDLDHQHAYAKAELGLVPQEFNLNIFETCEQILLNQAGYYGVTRKVARTRADALLTKLGLYHKKNNIVRHLSGGMKRRLMIARALIHKPSILILDEPTAGVDIEIRRSMWDFLLETNRQGTTIVLTTHYLEEAEQLCKNIAILNHGQLIAHLPMKELLKTLKKQTFVLNTFEPILDAFLFENDQFSRIDDTTLEVQIGGNETLNDMFQILTDHQIRIQSMRNKSNRLEELFLDIIKNDS